jgi:hypothetical protein
MLIVVAAQTKPPEKLLKLWLAGKIKEVPLPGELKLAISELAAEAYGM